MKSDPEHIYHYTKVCNLYPILLSRKLKMSKMEETNDPKERLKYFEGIIHHDFFNPEHECIQLLEDFMNNYPTVTCFTGDYKDKKGFNRPTMWTHYAENHKGICLKINTEKFLKENKNLDCKYNWVKYVRKEKFNWFEISKATTENDILKKLVFSKRDDWSSESEWRLFSLAGIEFCSIADSLESIILGLDFDCNLLPLIQTLTETTTIKIERIFIDDQTQNFFTEGFT